MKYNGKELVEMTPENWDGKTREMLIWDNGSPAPSQLTVIGYDSMGWIDCETLTHWSHCAEIPREEKENYENKIAKLGAENYELKAKIKSLSAERHEMAKNISADLIFELTERSIYENPYDGNIELHKIAEFVQNKILDYKSEKKTRRMTRRMTHRELARWLYNENGEWTNASMRTAYQHFVYDIERENAEVSEDIKIRSENETEWHEPLIEE